MHSTADRPARAFDLAELDAASFAGAVAHGAASRLFGLFNDLPPLDNWFSPWRDVETAAIDETIGDLAAYVARRMVLIPEQLWRHGQTLPKLMRDDGRSWDDLPFDERQAWCVFQATALAVWQAISAEQDAIHRAELQRLMAQRAQPLKREDSIFEEADGFHDLRPEAVAAARLGVPASAQALMGGADNASAAAAEAGTALGATVETFKEIAFVGPLGTVRFSDAEMQEVVNLAEPLPVAGKRKRKNQK